MKQLWYVLDENNKPVACDGLDAWARWVTREDRRRVDFTQLTNEVYVSTVFLGLDHGWGKGPPVLFETMVGGLDNVLVHQQRYSTWTEARAGHEECVNRFRTLLHCMEVSRRRSLH